MSTSSAAVDRLVVVYLSKYVGISCLEGYPGDAHSVEPLTVSEMKNAGDSNKPARIPG